jgi:hypothetical protein
MIASEQLIAISGVYVILIVFAGFLVRMFIPHSLHPRARYIWIILWPVLFVAVFYYMFKLHIKGKGI